HVVGFQPDADISSSTGLARRFSRTRSPVRRVARHRAHGRRATPQSGSRGSRARDGARSDSDLVGAWGMGHGAWGMGHGLEAGDLRAWGLGPGTWVGSK